MAHQNDAESSKSNTSGASLSDVVAVVTSSLALVVSVASAYYSYQFHRDSTGTQVIAEAYATYYDINNKQAENVDVGHIFVPAEDYARTATLVSRAVGDASPMEVARYQLKEKAMAEYMFTVFEQTIYQHDHAVSVGDGKRAAFLQTVLEYFTGRVLRNPRLLYYWSPAGGNLAHYLEAPTRAYYDRWVLNDPDNPLRFKPDTIGPYRARNSGDDAAYAGP